MEDGNLLSVMRELCTDDFIWSNSGLPTLFGQEGFRKLAAEGGFRKYIPISPSKHTSCGFNQYRQCQEHCFYGAYRSSLVRGWARPNDSHIAGVVEIRDGKISELRDFMTLPVTNKSRRGDP